ncbi:tumor protein p53-inducible protein 11b isoform X1 [Micropterus salmoides]|uniref:tumor protein p53-inducible protein 11b isoform X1 n=1 Tax=Micropterus salmoides TaxID=27706 RepID=UPI0018EB23E2|nr:tumor protein p53-inducible protein 11b isoform X1 [Micropterus salmoides]
MPQVYNRSRKHFFLEVVEVTQFIADDCRRWLPISSHPPGLECSIRHWTILFHHLRSTIGLSDSVYEWFSSYLTGRTEHVSLGEAKSLTHITCGVPQGSVLGPILFILYCSPLATSLAGMEFHSTAMLMMTTPSAIIHSTCLEEIRAWMKQNFLQLNSSKTEAILVGTPHRVWSSDIISITFSGQNIPLSTSATNLGVKMDSHLTFEAHIKHLCKTFFYLRNIAKLRPTLTPADAEKLVHAFVSSRLDYCNALLTGIPEKSLQKLQYIQNSAARILLKVRKHDHITPILKSLHWLPVSLRIEYKVSLLTHQCIHGEAPSYLKELLIPQTSTRDL